MTDAQPELQHFLHRPAGELLDHLRLGRDDLLLLDEPRGQLRSFSFRLGAGVRGRWVRVVLARAASLFSLTRSWPTEVIREAAVLGICEGLDVLGLTPVLSEADWPACDDVRRMLRVLEGVGSPRQLRLFACACCRRLWPLLGAGSRQAVAVAERFADGLAGEQELNLGRWAADREAQAGRGRSKAAAEVAGHACDLPPACDPVPWRWRRGSPTPSPGWRRRSAHSHNHAAGGAADLAPACPQKSHASGTTPGSCVTSWATRSAP